MSKRRRVMGMQLGDERHAGSLRQVIAIAQSTGFEAQYRGQLQNWADLMTQAQAWEPEIVLVGLGPDVDLVMLDELKAVAQEHGQVHRRWMLVSSGLAKLYGSQLGIFEATLDDAMNADEVADCLRGLRPRVMTVGTPEVARKKRKVLPFPLGPGDMSAPPA